MDMAREKMGALYRSICMGGNHLEAAFVVELRSASPASGARLASRLVVVLREERNCRFDLRCS